MKLMVTADDLGYCPQRNRGVMEAYEQGIVTQASLLLNGEATLDAVAPAQRLDLPLALHFNLTEGRPLCRAVDICQANNTPPSSTAPPPAPPLAPGPAPGSASEPSISPQQPPQHCLLHQHCGPNGPQPLVQALGMASPHQEPPSLPTCHPPDPSCSQGLTSVGRSGSLCVAADGMFFGKYDAFAAAARWSHQDIAAELRAQLHVFQSLTGRPCTHLDAHNHIFVLPPVYESIASLANTHLRSIRMPHYHEHVTSPATALSPFLKAIVREAKPMCAAFSQAGLCMADAFLGLDYDRPALCVDDILSDLRHLIDQGMRTCELMSHPGYPADPFIGGCGKGPDAFAQSSNRLRELHVLTDPALRRGLEELDIDLISFADL